MGLVLALWSASRGMNGLVTAINIAYEEKERRGFFKLTMIALSLTLGLIIGGAVAIALIAVLPAAVQLLPLGPATKWVLLIVQWPVLMVLVMLGLAVLYRYAPDRDKPHGGGFRRARSPQPCCGSWLPSASPFMSPTSTATTRLMGRWAAW
jgi:membrane protein